jgi:hypothetical protein
VVKLIPFLIVLSLMFSIVGCGGESGNSTDPAPASDTPAAASSDAPASGLCALFTQKEVEEFLGTPVGPGKSAGPLDSACQWDGTTQDNALVQVQVVGENFWEEPRLAEGYESLSGIGKKAFVVPEMGGWKAGALTEKVIMVSMVGGKADKNTTVKVLRTVLEKI